MRVRSASCFWGRAEPQESIKTGCETRKQGMWEPRNTPNTRKQGMWEPRNTPNTRKQKETDCGLFLGGESREIGTFRTLQKHRENMHKFDFCPLRKKTSFSQVFSHFWPIAWEFCSAQATRCRAPAALHFASQCPIRVVFRVARVAKPGTDDVQRELALEVRLLSSGCD
jgi:hypothetical protein